MTRMVRPGIDPGSVGLLEAHGTGTRVGDKVEFTALKACFGNIPVLFWK